MNRTFATRTLSLATALCIPFGLVACGGDKEDEASSQTTSTTTTTTSTTSTSTTPTSTEVPKEEEKKPEEKAPAEQSPAGQPPAPAPTDQINPLAPIQAKPVNTGRPGTPEERQQITDMLNNIAQGRTPREVLERTADSTCQSLIDANGGRGAFFPSDPQVAMALDAPLAALPDFRPAHVSAVDNLQVDGDVASATVTTVSEGQEPVTAVMRFHNEGGWKMCGNDM